MSGALVLLGDRLGLYRTLRDAGPCGPPDSPAAPARTSATSANGSPRRRRPAMSRYDPATKRFASRPSRRRSSPTRTARHSWPARSRSCAAVCRDEPKIAEAFRAAAASAGTSTTPACSAAPSASSAPATTRNLVEPWIPPSTACAGKARARRARRRCRLRPRRLDHRHGAGLPALAVSSASTIMAPRSSAARARPPSAPASRIASTFEVAARQGLAGRALRPRLPASIACTTWATRSARRAHRARQHDATTAR